MRPRHHPARFDSAFPGASSGGFSLVELLVVIAIVALLITITIAGLDRAREAGLRTAAIANAHQVGIAGAAYARDNKDTLPFTLVYRRGTVASAVSGPLEGFCPWSFAGRNCDPYWAGRAFDVEGADRPLNPYVAPGATFDAPDAPGTLDASPSDRALPEIPVLQIRGFEDSFERTYTQPGTPGGPLSSSPGVTCYADVGTGFLLNLRWLDAFSTITNPVERLRVGLSKFSSAARSGSPAHLVWFTDQSGEGVPRAADAAFSWNNAFDDDNRSIMGFVDGHVVYTTVKPGVMSDGEYSLVLTP